MKKTLLPLLLLILSAATVNGQNKVNVFSNENPNQINFGVGFWNGHSDFKGATPQLSLSYDRCVADLGNYGSIGAGLHFSYMESEYKLMPSDKWKLKESTAGLRFTYHYTIISNLEVYAAGMVLYSKSDFSDPAFSYLAKTKSKFDVSGSIGARYFFINNLGVFVGTGDGVRLNSGLTVRF